MKYISFLTLLGLGFMSYISINHSFAIRGADAIHFERFESQFPMKSLPYSITVPSASYSPYNTMGNEAKKYIPEMQYSHFSRMTRSNGTYNAELLKTNKYCLLVYSMEESTSDTLAPVITTLATFDSTGNRIDNIEFACQCTADFYKTGTIDTDRDIEIKRYKNIWMYDPKTKGYRGNEVLGHELVETRNYKLDDLCHFHVSEPSKRAQRVGSF